MPLSDPKVSLMPAWKRFFDLACILVAAPVLLPLAALVSLAIKIGSPGPVLFRQNRIGYQGKSFVCLKFRTMIVDADTGVHEGHLTRLMTSAGPMTKLDTTGDPRVLPGGMWLRLLGLDELPQVINVLRGEMSLVGPRPCLPYEYSQYSARHRRRFETPPGLTGLWQVSGKNRTTFEEMIDLDVTYIARRSLWLDLKIIFKTIPALLVQTYEAKARKRKTLVSSPSLKSNVSRPPAVPTHLL